MFCPKCGAKAVDGAVFCQKCGSKLIVEASNTSTPEHKVLPKTSHPKTAPSQKKKTKFSIILSIMAVLFLLLIIRGVADSHRNSENGKASRSSANATGVNLSQSYSNDKEGISFQYPSAWVPMNEKEINRYADAEEADNILVLLANETEDLPEEDSYIMVSKFSFTRNDVDRLFADDELFATDFARECDNSITIISTSITTLDGVPAREITYVDSNGIGYQRYFYAIDTTVYNIDFSWLGKSAGDKQRFFDAIIDSYTIIADTSYTDKPETVISSKAAEGLCYRGIPVDQLFGKSQADIISLLGEPDSSMFEGSTLVYGDTSMSFEDWSLHESYLSGIYGGLFEDYTYNGRPFTADGQKIIEIMGREPDYSDVMDQGKEYGTYFITYEWECLDSFARLELYVPADEYSTQTPSIYVYWWNSDAPVDGPGDEYYDDGPYEDYYLPVLPAGFEWVEGPSWDIDSDGFYMITGVIKNVSGKTKEYVGIIFNLYDNNYYQIGTAADGISGLVAGNSWRFEAYVFDDAEWYDFAELYGW